MLSIPSPNTDRALLTIAQLRAAVGIEDGSKDAELKELGDYVSIMIAQACRVATAPAVPPSLRLETVVETIELDVPKEWINLARLPVTEVNLVVENETTLDSKKYRRDGAVARLQRRFGAVAGCWLHRCDIAVTYAAGWKNVPPDLARAAIKFVQEEWTTGRRDRLLKRVRVDGISEREFWVDPTKDSVVPAEVMDILDRGGFVLPVFP
jgi:hypothetical protein